MAQPSKKAPIKKGTSIAELKAKMGLIPTIEKGKVQGASNADKPMDWLIMPQAFQDALRLPGFPLGYASMIAGHSNTGKSTLVNHAIVAAQKQGYLPVIYDTENNFDFNYAIDMGFEAEPVYGEVEEENPETGEITLINKIISWEGNFFYFNSSILKELYGNIDYSTGKAGNEYRLTAVIEDLVYSIKSFLEMQSKGELDPFKGILFIWDSVGTVGGLKTYKSKVGNPQFDAGTISAAMQDVLDDYIPSSRKITSKYTNTIIMVNKVWLDNMSSPVGPPTLEMKGGKSLTYRSRLILLLGGQLKASIKKLTATSKGFNYNWGIQTKIKVHKNQLPSPFNVTYEGDFICTDIGIIGSDKPSQDEYKKTHMPQILKRLETIAKETGSLTNLDEMDIEFTEGEEEIVE